MMPYIPKIFLFLLVVSFPHFVQSQKLDKKLQNELAQLIKGFNGDVGIYVKNLKNGKIAQINSDSLFPTASLIKLPIMCGVFNEVEKGNLDYHTDLIYRDSLLIKGEDILGSFKDGEKISLSKVQMLSITTSDNTASKWLQKLVGGEKINTWLGANGFKATRVNSSIPGRQGFYNKYGWGTTTPKEMADILVKIRNGEAISKAASERMYRNMIRIYWDGEALSQIPPFIQVISKQGALNASRSEVVLVNAPHVDYVFCIITKNQKDQSWENENEGFELIRKLSALLWHFYEPQSNWKPADAMEKYR